MLQNLHIFVEVVGADFINDNEQLATAAAMWQLCGLWLLVFIDIVFCRFIDIRAVMCFWFMPEGCVVIESSVMRFLAVTTLKYYIKFIMRVY